MNSWFSDAWSATQEEDPNDPYKQNTGDVPYAAPLPGPPQGVPTGQGIGQGFAAPPPVGINPIQGGFRQTEMEPDPNALTDNPLALPFGAFNAAREATYIPYVTPAIESIKPYIGDAINAPGSPLSGLNFASQQLGGPDIGQTIADQTPSYGLDFGLNAIGAKSFPEALVGVPLGEARGAVGNIATRGLEGFNPGSFDALGGREAAAVQLDRFPALAGGAPPPIHPNGGEYVFGAGVHGGGLPIPQSSGSLEDQLRASLEARGVTPPPRDIAPPFPERYPSIPEGTMGSEFPDVVAASNGRISPDSPAARMGAPLAYDPQFMTPPPADAAMRDLGINPDPMARPDMAQEMSRRLEGGGLPAEASSSVSPPPSSLTAEEIGNTMRQADVNAGLGDLDAAAKLPTPAEIAGASNLEGDARLKAMENFGNTPLGNTPNPAVQDWLNSPNGQAAMAQRDAAVNAGLKPGETATVSSGGNVPPNGPRTSATGGAGGGSGNTAIGGNMPPTPRGVNPNAFQQAVAVVRAPVRVMLAGGHMFRQGVGVAVTHWGEAGTAFRGFGRSLVNPESAAALRKEVRDLPFVGGSGPEGFRAIDFATPHQRVNPAFVDKMIDRVPVFGEVLKRLQDGGSTYLGILRDSTYNTAAERIASTIPDADPKMYRDTYLALSHSTGHATNLHGAQGAVGAAQGVGIGPQAVVARFQNLADLVTKSGAPVPWAAGARGEVVRGLLGTAGVIAMTDVVGQQLGATVPLPFGADAKDLTNPYGLNSQLFKAVTTTPDLAYKTTYSGGSGYDTVLKLFGNAALDIESGNFNNLKDHLTGWLRGQAGPVPSVLIDLVGGKDWKGSPYDFNTLKGEARHGFIERWAPIAAKSLYDAYNAWGPEGLARAAPSLGAYEVQTQPTTVTDQRNAVKDDSRLPEAIRGVDPANLGPRGKDALDTVLKQDYPQAQAQAKENQKESENPVFTKYHEVVDQANQQADQRKTELYNMLRDGTITGEQARQGRAAIESAASGKREAARNDPEYKKAVSEFEQNDVSKALNTYYQIGQTFKTADGKPDFDKIHQTQADFLKFVEQQNPETGKLLQFEVGTSKATTNPLDRIYDLAQPTLQHYFSELKDPVQRSNERRGDPKADALLNLLGYESKTLTPQAATMLQQMRQTLPDAKAPVAAAAPVRSAVAAPAPAPPPMAPVQPLTEPAPTGSKLPPVVSNDAQQRQNFVGAMAAPARAYAQTTGIPPAVWAAMGASESNWGRAQSIFGIMGKGTAGGQNYDTFEIRPGGVRENTNSQFAAYNNLDDAFKHFVDLTSTGRYAPAWQHLQETGDWQGFLHGINQAGYATAPNWADSIISLTNHIEKTYPQVYGR